MDLSNSTLLKKAIYSIYSVASRRTSSKSAEEIIETALSTLTDSYPFFKNVSFKVKNLSYGEIDINLSSNIDNVNISDIGHAIESLIRIVYNDLSEEAGLYFITEFKQFTDKKIVDAIINSGVDLDQIQVEQHFAYTRKRRKKEIKKGDKKENLLGYTWKKVSRWSHKEGSKYCTLYDNSGNVLDRVNLDRVIQNYVERLSGVTETNPEELEKMVRVYEKEYSLLKLMYEQDMDAETARNLLNISMEELNNIVKKLLGMEMLQYISDDTIKLTQTGIDLISQEEDK